MKIRDFSAAIEAERVKTNTCDNLDYTPLFVPTDCELPETSQQAISRILLQSGLISHDDYEKMIGVTYDGDFNDDEFDDEDDGYDEDDGFKLSSYAQYEDEGPTPRIKEVNNDPQFPIFEDKMPSQPEPVKDTDEQEKKD